MTEGEWRAVFAKVAEIAERATETEVLQKDQRGVIARRHFSPDAFIELLRAESLDGAPPSVL